ncbi:MAG: tyrosine-protein phosphatase [Pseudomonadota bacterium]
MKSKWLRKRNILYLLIIAFIVFAIWYCSQLFLFDNFHVVIPDEIYRSAQMDTKDLQAYSSKYHIKTIINLRGAHPDDAWYRDEDAFTRSHDINHYNLALSAKIVPPVAKLKTLIHLIETSPKPVLIHCQGGADRTGLASAVAIILSGDSSVTDMEHQISWRYGALSPSTVGYQVMTDYLDYIQSKHQPYGEQSFLAWANQVKVLAPHKGVFVRACW